MYFFPTSWEIYIYLYVFINKTLPCLSKDCKFMLHTTGFMQLKTWKTKVNSWQKLWKHVNSVFTVISITQSSPFKGQYFVNQYVNWKLACIKQPPAFQGHFTPPDLLLMKGLTVQENEFSNNNFPLYSVLFLYEAKYYVLPNFILNIHSCY